MERVVVFHQHEDRPGADDEYSYTHAANEEQALADLAAFLHMDPDDFLLLEMPEAPNMFRAVLV